MKPNLDFIEVYKKAHPMMTKQDCQKAYNSEWAILKKELGEGNDARLKKVSQVIVPIYFQKLQSRFKFLHYYSSSREYFRLNKISSYTVCCTFL